MRDCSPADAPGTGEAPELPARAGGGEGLRAATRWAAITSLAGTGLTLAFNVVLTRLGSPAEVAAVFTFIASGTILAQVVQLGFQTTVLRYIPKARAEGSDAVAGATARLVLILVIANGVVIAALASLFAAAWPGVSDRLTGAGSSAAGLALGGFALLVGVRLTVSAIDRAYGRYRESSFLGTLAPAFVQTAMLLIFAGAFAADSAWAMILALVAAQALVSAAALTLLAIRNDPAGSLAQAIRLRDLVVSGLGLFLNSFLFAVFPQLGILIANAFGTPEDVATYGLAARLTGLAAAPILLYVQFISPLIAARFAVNDRQGMEHVLRRSASVATLYGAALALGALIAGPFALGLVFGPFYAAAAWPLTILLAGQAITYWLGFGSRALEMSGFQQFATLAATAALVVGGLGSIVAFKEMGVVGVAAAISVGLCASRSIGAAFAWRILGVKTLAGFQASDLQGLARLLRLR